MHICFASLNYPLNGGASGVGTQTRSLAQGLAARGIEVSVIMLSAASETEPLTDGAVRIYPTATTSLHWYLGKIPALGKLVLLPVRELEYSFAVWRALRRVRADGPPDLIEATETGALFVTLCSRRTPVLIRLHGEQYTFHKYTPNLKLTIAVRLSRLLQRSGLRRADALICPGTLHAREIANELKRRHPPLAVIPNTTLFEISPNQAPPRDAATVLYAGRLERLKGIPVLLRTAAQTAHILPDVRFVFAGRFQPTAFKSEFERLAQELDIEQRITLLGELDQETLTAWYLRATVGTLPSYYETFGLAALEQMCFGLPVIGTRAGGLSEIIQDGVNGLLVEPGDATGFAGALVKLLTDPMLRAQIGDAARERAEHFRIANILPANEQLYAWVRGEIESEPGPHIFLSPHLDDVVLSCGGMIQRLIKSGKAVRVVNVFSGQPQAQTLSAFARHLHAKWKLGENVVLMRRQEDLAAMQKLGASDLLYWEFTEAPYRRGRDNQPLYTTYAEMRGNPAESDREMEQALSCQVQQQLESMPETTILYVPLALGQHVDHQILFQVGKILQASGRHVRFYEDYPYVENYTLDSDVFNWIPKMVSISVAAKARAAKEYTSQLRGLGGDPQSVEQRLARVSRQTGARDSAERLWEYIPRVLEPPNSAHSNELGPFRLKPPTSGFRAWRKFADTFRWHDLDELLPVGSGICLDVGCGQSRHRAVIESRGYRWVGLERGDSPEQQLRGNAERLGIASARLAAVTLWQVMEYVAQPEQVFAEVARVLEAGGVVCGILPVRLVSNKPTFKNKRNTLEQFFQVHALTDLQIYPLRLEASTMSSAGLSRNNQRISWALALPRLFILFFSWWRQSRLGREESPWRDDLFFELATHVAFSARKMASTRTT